MIKIINLPDDWEKQVGTMSDSEIADFLYGICRNGKTFPDGTELNVDCDKAEWWSDGCEGYKFDGKLCGNCKKCLKQRENSLMGESLMIDID